MSMVLTGDLIKLSAYGFIGQLTELKNDFLSRQKQRDIYGDSFWAKGYQWRQLDQFWNMPVQSGVHGKGRT